MLRHLFLHIIDAVKGHDNVFLQKRDAMGALGLSTLQKATAIFRIWHMEHQQIPLTNM